MATRPPTRSVPGTAASLTRRTLMAGLARGGAVVLGGGLMVGGVGACTMSGPRSGENPLERVPRERASCVPAARMESYERLGSARLRYEVNETFTPVRIEPGFAAQLEAWLAEWNDLTGAAPQVLSNYGAWIGNDGSCDSWHHAGRAFDFAQLRADGAPVVSCREDLWGGDPSPEQVRGYWALAASLHLHFAYVLTYLYDAAHHNHIHVDNGQSGAERSRFSRGSRVQVQAVQAMCTHVWDRPLSITGRWDGPTREAAEDVLRVNGLGERFSGDDAWHAFLTATARH